MKILLVNDDGIAAKGIKALAEVLAPHHEVVVVAPQGQQSCTSHAVTLHEHLSYEEVFDYPCKAYALKGTPCDCVKFGMIVLVQGVDLVISGINDTTNLGTDVIYSGTVNAAVEAAIAGAKGIAVSVDVVGDDYSYIAQFVKDNLEVLASMCDGERIVSINCNSSRREDIKGIKLASCGIRRFDDYYVESAPNRFHLKGSIINMPSRASADVIWAERGYLCISPIKYQFTDEAAMEELDGKMEEICW